MAAGDEAAAPRKRPQRSGCGSLSRRVAVAGAMAGMVAGCLVPGPITSRDEDNAPVRLDLEAVSPRPEERIIRSRAVADDNARTTVFTVRNAVRDPDGDRLVYAWYLDYNPDAPFESLLPEESVELAIDPCDDANPIFRIKDDFTLTVIVSDRPLTVDVTNPTLRTFPDDANTVTVIWRLELRGSCPAQAPVPDATSSPEDAASDTALSGGSPG